MLAPPSTGNMIDIYRRTEQARRRQIRRQATKSIKKAVERSTPVECEISEGATADWYLIKTLPGDEARALRWLARRRFGVFRPMQQRTDKRNDTKLQGWEPVFPGWLFVFVWDIRKLKDRLRACPGVFDILCDPVSQEPVPVDQSDEHGVHFIDRLRALSWVYHDNAPRARHHVVARSSTKQKVQRPDKKQRKALDNLKEALKAKCRWDAKMWDTANDLAPHRRIALLEQYLQGSAA